MAMFLDSLPKMTRASSLLVMSQSEMRTFWQPSRSMPSAFGTPSRLLLKVMALI